MSTKLSFQSDYAFPPGETLLETLETLGLTQKELATTSIHFRSPTMTSATASAKLARSGDSGNTGTSNFSVTLRFTAR
jgi:hypothetical protein